MTVAFHSRRSLLLAAAAAAVACTTGSAQAQDVKLRLGHPLTTPDAAHKAMVYFADNVKKRSNGRIDIQVFPADQLGRQKDVGEMVRQGANVIQLTDALFLGEWVPDAAILQAPYLMDKPDDFRKILGSEWLDDLNKRLAAKNIKVLSWNNYFGTRQILSKKPIRTPADLAGMNFRCAARRCMSRWSRRWARGRSPPASPRSIPASRRARSTCWKRRSRPCGPRNSTSRRSSSRSPAT